MRSIWAWCAVQNGNRHSHLRTTCTYMTSRNRYSWYLVRDADCIQVYIYIYICIYITHGWWSRYIDLCTYIHPHGGGSSRYNVHGAKIHTCIVTCMFAKSHSRTGSTGFSFSRSKEIYSNSFQNTLRHGVVFICDGNAPWVYFWGYGFE